MEAKQIYLECACYSPEDTLRFSYYEEKDPEFYVLKYLHTGAFWSRLKTGLKYIFGFDAPWGHFSETILRPEDVTKLKELCQEYENYYQQQK